MSIGLGIKGRKQSKFDKMRKGYQRLEVENSNRIKGIEKGRGCVGGV